MRIHNPFSPKSDQTVIKNPGSVKAIEKYFSVVITAYCASTRWFQL